MAESVPALNAFIEAELDGPVESAPEKPRTSGVVDLLNDIFHQSLSGFGATSRLSARVETDVPVSNSDARGAVLSR